MFYGCMEIFVVFWEILWLFLVVDVFEYCVVFDVLFVYGCFVDWVEEVVCFVVCECVE